MGSAMTGQRHFCEHAMCRLLGFYFDLLYLVVLFAENG